MFLRLTYISGDDTVDVSPKHIIRMRSNYSRSKGTLITLESGIEIHVKQERDTIYDLIKQSQLPDVVLATQLGPV